MTTAYNNAIRILQKASTPNGFTAAIQEEDNYRRVWTRDSALCGLAALASEKEDLVQVYKASIETIFAHQHPVGFIPSNVSEKAPVSYGGVVGRVDNHTWIVISACTYAQVTGEHAWLMPYEGQVQKCFQLMQAWEFNGRGLLYVPQSADWADEYHHHGYVLYNQLLRLWALRAAAQMFGNKGYAQEASRVGEAIEQYFSGEAYYAVHTERQLKEKAFPFWLMGFNPSTVYTQFDLQANALALLLEIGKPSMQEATVAFVRQLSDTLQTMLPSFHPAIEEDDIHMHELANNYAYRFRNAPHEFHNGGLWPVWNGLMAFAIAKYDALLAEKLSKKIADACEQNNWEFNECFHGQSGKAVGVPHCAWSAAGYLLSVNTSFAHSITT